MWWTNTRCNYSEMPPLQLLNSRCDQRSSWKERENAMKHTMCTIKKFWQTVTRSRLCHSDECTELNWWWFLFNILLQSCHHKYTQANINKDRDTHELRVISFSRAFHLDQERNDCTDRESQMEKFKSHRQQTAHYK